MDRDKRSPVELEYANAPTSPFDRPVQPIRELALTVQRWKARFKWLVILPAVICLLWYIFHRREEIEQAFGTLKH